MRCAHRSMDILRCIPASRGRTRRQSSLSAHRFESPVLSLRPASAPEHDCSFLATRSRAGLWQPGSGPVTGKGELSSFLRSSLRRLCSLPGRPDHHLPAAVHARQRWRRGFATHVRVPARGLCPVPENLPPNIALELLSVVADAVTTPYEAIRRSGPGGCGCVHQSRKPMSRAQQSGCV